MAETAGRDTAVGTSVPRVDGTAKVTGRAIYVDDIALEGGLYGSTVRSAVPHGRLDAIVRDPDFDWTDVVVATADDIPGENYVALIETDQPALVPVGGTIRHVGEAVALVAAPTRARAIEARDHVRLEITELPAVFTIEDSVAKTVVLHGDDNVFKKFQILKGEADVEAALAAADHVIEGTYRTGAQEQMYIEPQGMIAHWPAPDTCRIVGSLQCPYYVHKAMKVFLGLPDDSVIIEQSVTGGGFGGKEEYPSMLAAHASLLARVANAPVKLVYERDEDIAVTTKRHPSLVHHRLGIDRDGNIVAADIDVLIDGGAYATLSAVVLSRAVLHAGGPYKCPTLRIRGRAMATNTPPHGAFRGFGAPQTTFAYERQMHKAARLIGVEPFEYRRRTMLRSGDTTATSQTLTYSVGSDKVLEAVAEAAGPPPEREGTGSSGQPVRRGRGLCFYFHGAGFTGSGEERLAAKASVAVLPGGRFEVRASSTDIGQGALTTFTQIAATALGVPIEQVTNADQSTANVPDSGPTVASRTCMVVGGVVERAATALRERIETWAADNGINSTPLSVAAGAMVAEQVDVAELVQYSPPPGIKWDDDTYTGSAYPVFGWAACLVDVSVDLDTYEVTVDRCVQAVDVGKAINPVIVKGQIEGGTLQALGWALLEAVTYDRGRVTNANMTNCIVPTFADTPELETFIVEEPYPFGPHGAKGVGEIPMDGPGAAAAGAVEDALGVAFDELPILPEVIQRSVQAGGAS